MKKIRDSPFYFVLNLQLIKFNFLSRSSNVLFSGPQASSPVTDDAPKEVGAGVDTDRGDVTAEEEEILGIHRRLCCRPQEVLRPRRR